MVHRIENRASGRAQTRRAVIVGAGACGLAFTADRWASRAFAQGTRPLTYALSTYPPNLRPFDFSGAASQVVKALMHRGLLIFGADGKIHPEVAESWELSDPKTYVFKLRENAFFHNGEPVTAEDVKFSLDQIVSPGSTAFFKQDFQIVEKVEATSAKIVTITLKQPTASFAPMLANGCSSIISAKAAIANPNRPVGCGPFILQNSENGVSISLKANKTFYKAGLPRSDAVRFVVYADDSLRVSALEAGDVDIIEYVPWQSMKSLANNPNMSMQSALAAYMYIVFNASAGPFKDARVRRAVALGIRRDDIVKAAFLGYGEPLDGLPISPDSPFYDKASAHLWRYDPDRARSLLKEASASNIPVTLLSTATYGMHKDTAEVIQQNLAEIGMQVELNLPEWGVRVALGNQGKYQFAINGGGGLFGDPDELTPFVGSGSPSYQRSLGMEGKGIDDLLAKARHEIDEVKRRADYADLSRLCAEEVPICTLNYRTQAFALRNNVKDFQSLPGFLMIFSGSALDTAYLA
ncbi:ABC-type transport system substrate-binding protein [Bradyrhizobium diazoefficiens]|uniref:ABC transporter substrate-binding protein n=1 Tax=Bradyrhizobium diazoefficiens TaxID=1355477 RepID=UPI003512CCCF